MELRKAVPATAGDDFGKPGGGDAEVVGQGEGGGRRSEVCGEQQVVEQLGGLPGSQIAEVNHRVGMCVEDRATTLHHVGITTDHHQQAPAAAAGPPPLTGASRIEIP
jgi:hypothetical protein